MSNEYIADLVARARAAFLQLEYATQEEAESACTRIVRELALRWPGDADLIGADVMASI